MDWARVLAYVTGTVDQELLARIEYLARMPMATSSNPVTTTHPAPCISTPSTGRPGRSEAKKRLIDLLASALCEVCVAL
jgi:hypothetical protein